MKKSFFLTVILTTLLLSCKKEKVDICDSQVCVEYQNIWKELFLTRNNITNEYFDEHITITHTNISSWNEGESFRIDYYVEIDWAKISAHDQFIIKKSPNAPPYPSLNIPVDTYLTKEDIKKAVNHLAFSSYMTRMYQYNHLKYSSKHKAIKAVKSFIPYKNPSLKRLYYKQDKYNLTSNGHPFFEGGGTINNENNECFNCEIDLITGEITYHKTVCWIE